MRALSLYQPWAGLVALGLKTVETRNWRHKPKAIVGERLAIHAAKSGSQFAGCVRANAENILNDFCIRPRTRGPLDACAVFGAILGHVQVVDVRWGGADDDSLALCEATGLVCMEVNKAVLLPEPIPWKGSRGFFRVPDAHIPAFCERCLRRLTGWFVAENPELAPCQQCLRLCCDRCVVAVEGYYGVVCRTCAVEGYYGVVCRTCKGESKERCR
ncbi:MAG TPA: ASCH domain-containing protein [Planctomycetota bacterium]|nr:ASCH domain-containing protein [Planctomycetota bacterium]